MDDIDSMFNEIVADDGKQAMADNGYKLYLAYQKAGFTEPQAFRLVEAYIRSSVVTINQIHGGEAGGE